MSKRSVNGQAVALRPCASPLARMLGAANRLRSEAREMRGIAEAGIRYISSIDAPDTGYKRSSSANRRWQLAQRVHRYQLGRWQDRTTVSVKPAPESGFRLVRRAA